MHALATSNSVSIDARRGNYRTTLTASERGLKFWITMIVVAAVGLLQGCASYRATYPGKPLSEQVRTGDKVRLQTVAGSQHEFKVTDANLDGIYNGETFYAYTDVAQLEVLKKKTTDSATTLAVAGIVAGVALIMIMVDGVGDTVEGVFDGN